MLSDCCAVCPVCLSVCLSVCDVDVLWQNDGWIKMSLGMEVGLSPGDIVLDGDPATHKRSTASPNFRPVSVVTKRLDGSTCHLVGS